MLTSLYTAAAMTICYVPLHLKSCLVLLEPFSFQFSSFHGTICLSMEGPQMGRDSGRKK